jgi:hypothetical protein
MTMGLETSSQALASDDYYPQDDASEAERLAHMHGLGSAVYESEAEDFAGTLKGLGLHVNFDRDGL